MKEPSKPLRILLVEDHPDFRTRLAGMLATRYEGFIIDTAQDAREGVARLQEAEYAAVLTDWSMPGGGGLRVLERAAFLHPTSTRVVLTMHPSAHIRRSALSMDAAAVIDKTAPFDPLWQLLDFLTPKQDNDT